MRQSKQAVLLLSLVLSLNLERIEYSKMCYAYFTFVSLFVCYLATLHIADII